MGNAEALSTHLGPLGAVYPQTVLKVTTGERDSRVVMEAARYTIVLTCGSVCTNEEGRRAVIASLKEKTRDVNVPVVDPCTGALRVGAIDLLELVTILKHDSEANPAVLKQLLGPRDRVVSMADYMARRGTLSSAI